MDILSILVQMAVVYFAYKLGKWSVLIPIKLALEKLSREKGIDLKKTLEELQEQEITATVETKEELLEIERVGGVYFAYGNQGRFLAQGPDFRSMMENIKQRFPQHNFRVNRYNPNLTEEETGRLVKAIFETFGDQNGNSAQR